MEQPSILMDLLSASALVVMASLLGWSTGVLIAAYSDEEWRNSGYIRSEEASKFLLCHTASMGALYGALIAAAFVLILIVIGELQGRYEPAPQVVYKKHQYSMSSLFDEFHVSSASKKSHRSESCACGKSSDSSWQMH